MNHKRAINIRTALLYTVFFVVICFLLTQKKDFMVDELLTYNLSNAEEWFSPTDGVVYSPADAPFVEAMASNGEFDLRHVWNQQTYDTHPPFYYVLVHAVCVLFPGTVSIMYPGVINILFALGTLFLYRKILQMFIDDENVIFGFSVIFCLSAGVLEIMAFLRMYVMLMFFITAIAYLIIKNIERFCVKDFVLLFIITICGTLTHYYFLVFAFFISAVIGFIMLKEKRIKEIIGYIATMGSAGVIIYMIFPAIVYHIFKRGRGAESIENIKTSNLAEQLKGYIDIINAEVFGGLLGFIILLIALLWLVALIKPNIQKENVICHVDRIKASRYCCLLLPSLGYVLLIAKSAPYIVDRYVASIYAVGLAGVWGVLYTCFKNVYGRTKVRNLIIMCFAALVVILSFIKCDWEYLYKGSEERLNNSEVYGENADAIVLYDHDWRINSHYLEIKNCQSVVFYETNSYEQFSENVDVNELPNEIAFFLFGMNSEEFINEFLAENNEYSIVLDNGTRSSGHSYYLKK